MLTAPVMGGRITSNHSKGPIIWESHTSISIIHQSCTNISHRPQPNEQYLCNSNRECNLSIKTLAMLTDAQAQVTSYISNSCLLVGNIHMDYLPPSLVKQCIITIMVLASAKLGIEHKQTWNMLKCGSTKTGGEREEKIVGEVKRI